MNDVFSMRRDMTFKVIITLVLTILSGAVLANGSQLYKDKACWTCHGKDGNTPLLPIYPKIAGQNAQYVERQILDIKSGARVSYNSAAMKGVLPLVSDNDIRELAEFVSKLKPSPSLSSAVPLVLTAHPVDKTKRFNSYDYVWNDKKGDKIEALKLKGNIARGKKSYEICTACHLSNGSGITDTPFPLLAGQHSTVMIKQLSDFRAGARDEPTMEPFALTRKGPQELADLAAYVETLCIPLEHGRYDGPDANQKIAAGKVLYEDKCKNCHGAEGEGDKARFYPMIAGQHYKYLVHQLIEIRDIKRRNLNPEMVKALKNFTDNDLATVSAYMASLNVAGKMCPVVSNIKKRVSR